MSAVSGYGAIEGERRNTSSRLNAPMAAVAFAACAAVLVVVVVTSQQSQSVELADFPKTDLGLLRVLRGMNGAPKNAIQSQWTDSDTTQMAASPKAKSSQLSMTQQYARIMQNQGYFAPWSRQNGWADRVAIDNIRKASTPQALAERQEMIQKENAKFAKKFATPHTAQYTGKHESLSEILDPKYEPWSNDGPRKAYYQGY